jgi:hypothetical protein
LSVLDQSPIAAGCTAIDAVRQTVELAQLAERLGYTRYWLAEHHSSSFLAGASPEIMVARVASATSAIRVGSGGVMLQHYSAFKVAENFRVLEALFPGASTSGSAARLVRALTPRWRWAAPSRRSMVSPGRCAISPGTCTMLCQAITPSAGCG